MNAQALVEQAVSSGRLDDLAASLDAAELQVRRSVEVWRERRRRARKKKRKRWLRLSRPRSLSTSSSHLFFLRTPS